MSSIAAASLVIGILVGVGGPILWWIFFRMDSHADFAQDTSADDPTPMTEAEVAQVESELQVIVPSSLRKFLLSERNTDDVDYGTVAGSPEGFIEMTKEYRAGFVGLPSWPKEWLYLGDAGDACPYVIDCMTGKMFELDKGDLRRKRLQTWDSFDAFIAEMISISRSVLEDEK
jgi:hypothetical protein